MGHPEAVQIDGSYGEGGGQVIRTSVSLSALTGRPVEICNVRAGRAKPGLQPQHLTAVKAVAHICRAEVEGAAVGSQRLVFVPGWQPQPGSYRFDIGTAGATTLVAQSLLLPLALSGHESKLDVVGGTHVPFAPTEEYLEMVYLPALARFGISVSCGCPSAGFYPKGGGELRMSIFPAESIQPIDLTERGGLLALKASIVTSQLPNHVGERGAGAVEAFMRGIGRKVEIERRDMPSRGAGAAVVITADCENGLAGFSSIGKQGKPMEQVADEACRGFLDWWKSGASCDEHLADQLVLPAALAAGESRWTIPTVTEHLRTVVWVTRQFLPIETTITDRPDGTSLVTLSHAGK